MRVSFIILTFLLLDSLSLPTWSWAETDQDISFANTLLKEIHKQDSSRDATCWTTVRMMEQFYTKRALSEPGMLMKIEVMKSLAVEIWKTLSRIEKTCTIQESTFEDFLSNDLQRAVVVPPKPVQASADSLSLYAYQGLTESWRVLLSVLFDPAYRKADLHLKSLEPKAARRLTELLSVLTLELLQDASKISQKRNLEYIGYGEVQEAFRQKIQTLHLDAVPGSASIACQEEIFPTQEQLGELTRENMDFKVRSLRQWNHAVWPKDADDAHGKELLQQLSPRSIELKTVDHFLERVERAIRFIAEGKRSDPGLEVSTSPQYFRIDGRTIDSRSETPPILTSAYVFDSSETVFPRHTDIRGDLHLWLRKVPSNTSQQKNQTYHLRLNGPDLDAVRDTTLHWQMMRNVYRDPTLPPLDPFAAELLAERTSEMLWFLIYRGSQLVSNAANQDAKITVANLMFDSAQYSLVPREISAPEHDTRDLPKFTPIHFEDVTAQSGISQTCTGEWEKKLLGRFRSADEHAGIDLQSFAGSGVAVGDINSDGLLDLFIGGQDCSRLFFNLGDFRFEDRSEQLLPKEMGKTVRHPLLIDLDNDGRLDLVLVQEVPPSQILYQGRSGKFDTVVNLPTDSAAQNVSVFDYDHDGFLDLFVGQYGIGFEPSIAGRNGSASLLFQGQAKRKFQEVSKRAGLITTGWSLASATPDINNDGWLDLFIANDFGEDELFLNNRDGTFRSVADEYNVNDRGNGMSATLVDLNNDLLPDIYVSTIDTFSKQISFKLPKPNDLIPMTTRILSSSFSLAGNQFHLSKAGHPYQSAIAKIFETGDRGWGWSANFVDLDNDFDLDFVLATGWLQGSLAGEQANQLFENIDGRLYLNEAPNGFNFVGSSRAIAAGDFDNDGKTDLVVTNFADVPRIFRNTTTSAGAISNERVVRLRFDDRFPPSKIIGSKALAILQSGKQQVHFFQAGESYLSQSPFETQFAIPKNDTLRELSFISAEGQRIPLKLPELNGNIVISAQILE